jgi:Na+/proline symporter
MSNQTKSRRRWFLWLGAVIIAAVALGILHMAFRPAKTTRITVTMDPNGTPRIAGVPLLTTNIRDGTFAAAGALGIKAALAIPNSPTNDTQRSNVINTLKSMSRAGLFTNAGPSPYE